MSAPIPLLELHSRLMAQVMDLEATQAKLVAALQNSEKQAAALKAEVEALRAKAAPTALGAAAPVLNGETKPVEAAVG